MLDRLLHHATVADRRSELSLKDTGRTGIMARPQGPTAKVKAKDEEKV